MAIALIGGWYILGARTDLASLLPLALVGGIMMPVVVGINLRKQVNSFRSQRVVLDDVLLRRTQDGFASVELPLAAITAIEESPGHGLIVRGKGFIGQSSTALVVFLSESLTDYGELRDRLASVWAIELKPRKTRPLLVIASAAASVGALVAFYRSTTPAIVVGSGALIIVLMVWCFFAIILNPATSKSQRLAAWTVWLVVASVATRLWFYLQATAGQ
ncbi:MAG TPA: hypothetical protein VG897_02000 [Terriglobales bacterium]|nr:hypothetical protein [Terriglobales bacterium]